MKNIKTLLLGCVLSMFALAGYAQEMKVGHVTGKTYVVNDEKALLTQWETELKGLNIESGLASIEIKQGMDGKDSYYMLIASSADDRVHMAAVLQLSNNEFFLLSAPHGTAESVVCIRDKACDNGCAPARSGGKWICDDGCAEGECTKSTTVRQWQY